MEEGPIDYTEQIFMEMDMKIKDMEGKQRILKERLLLIGKNLLQIKEKNNQSILKIKKDIEIINKNMEKMKSFLETISSEFSKFARKEDLDILSKQAKMFQPLEFVRKKDLEKLRK